MALIEIDGLPFLIAWWIFSWQTVSHNQMVCVNSGEAETSATSPLRRPGLQWFGSAA